MLTTWLGLAHDVSELGVGGHVDEEVAGAVHNKERRPHDGEDFVHVWVVGSGHVAKYLVVRRQKKVIRN